MAAVQENTNTNCCVPFAFKYITAQTQIYKTGRDTVVYPFQIAPLANYMYIIESFGP